ncbi:hypothetical protein ASE92_11760 [Pedobacter sp. Leaf41]|uniref:phytanoyl-CoA dioxygenase family protein n=1 Tax=Pedobacter sp. Leaf41 TaxID=1736218 RepID=UPI0007033D8A|nr:phytanoyl-CoA dioxygenase family protein [Pedobacter sp. Leaf41]KQN34280.1 hypothetical protein ASE92_11760 [Pedobacter sp. Leaf41]
MYQLPEHQLKNNTSPDCPFIGTYYENHRPNVAPAPQDEALILKEKMFLSFFQIGIFETYQFLYQECRDVAHFKEWLIGLKGLETHLKSMYDFNKWLYSGISENDMTLPQLLDEENMDFWRKNGYLKISGLVPGQDCEEVVYFMKRSLRIRRDDPKTWYQPHELLQGMMFQRYQAACIDKIRHNPKLKAVFMQLYGGKNIVPNAEKLSYNPPENTHYRFAGSPLHWDIDFSRGIQYHIQGLVYLNDVPAERGALTLIPGFHHEIDMFLSKHAHQDVAIEKLREENRQIAVAGKKGDLIVWLEALPHAASPNRSDQPRFVQYVSFGLL